MPDNFISGTESYNFNDGTSFPIFLHIPKCAGTSMLHILNDVYGKFFMHFPDWPSQELVIAHLAKFIKKRTFAPRAIGGHMEYGIHRTLGIDDPFYFSLVRDPVSRCISHFLFKLERHKISLPNQSGKLPSFPTRFYCTSGSNIQTRVLDDQIENYDFTAKNQRLLDVAIKKVSDQLIKCSTIENFDNYIEVLSSKLDWSSNIVIPNARKSALPRPFLTDDELEQLRQHNSLDQELYNFVNSLEK